MLIWLHGVSIGESLANITLSKALSHQYPKAKILLTSTTKTSEKILTDFVHKHPQMSYDKYPHDWPWQVNAFLNKWQPDVVIFGESELWPFMLWGLRRRNIPAALINARLSEKSYRRWKWLLFLIHLMLKTFSIILAQSDDEAARYVALGGENVFTVGNLKFATEPLTHDRKKLATLKKQLNKRPLMLFASTHAPEEEMAVRLHKKLKKDMPDLLSIIVPRHPDRGEKIMSTLGKAVTQRSKNAPITENTEIYLADTLGELGLFYTLCPIAFIGNSMTTQPGGGHNLIEPAQLNCAIIYGPEMFNFKEMDQDLTSTKGAIKVTTEAMLYKKIKELLKNPQKQKELTKAAVAYAQSKQDVLPNILEKLSPVIDTAKHAGS
ncbi:MAG: 3-deoxy-D-manno-octulosonic acid transferase [Micavibrio sp.]|nr:3-deoxy-D-manno-octulosonic acid transferase [Micavibrio sp.]|tara:strand:- start:1473 stop:2609 length:1137 start_codon:yes stop_codon:yes gene_type:complete